MLITCPCPSRGPAHGRYSVTASSTSKGILQRQSRLLTGCCDGLRDSSVSASGLRRGPGWAQAKAPHQPEKRSQEPGTEGPWRSRDLGPDIYISWWKWLRRGQGCPLQACFLNADSLPSTSRRAGPPAAESYRSRGLSQGRAEALLSWGGQRAWDPSGLKETAPNPEGQPQGAPHPVSNIPHSRRPDSWLRDH